MQVRAASNFKVMAYKVTLKTPSGDEVIECADDVYILDAAEEAGTLDYTIWGRGRKFVCDRIRGRRSRVARVVCGCVCVGGGRGGAAPCVGLDGIVNGAAQGGGPGRAYSTREHCIVGAIGRLVD